MVRAKGRRSYPVNRDTFLAYVGQVLCPTLTEGDIVVMDNLPPTKAMRSSVC
jgi:hypothetical protein